MAACIALIHSAAPAFAAEIIGHRGASHDAPENTLAAVNLAWRQQADAVEIDVHLSKDGRIVVIHDKSTKKLASKNRLVKSQTLAELKTLDVGRWKGKAWAGERIPTLAEVLATIPKGKRLFIEVKCGLEVVAELKSVLKSTKTRPRRTAVVGFSLETMTAVKRTMPEIEVYLVAKQTRSKLTRRWKPSIAALIRKAKSAKLDGLDLNASKALNRTSVARIKQAGLKVYVWTVNSPKEAMRLKDAGVDGIATDRPGWLRAQLASTPSAN